MYRVPNSLPLMLLAMLFVVPFLIWNHAPPILSFHAEWWAAMLGLLVVLVSHKTWAAFPLPHSCFVLFGFSGLLVAQILLGVVSDISQAVLAVLYLIGAAVLLVVSRSLSAAFGAKKVVLYLAWGLVVGGELNALLSVLQKLPADSVLITGLSICTDGCGTSGSLGQANHLASYLALALASVLYLIASKNINFLLAIGLGMGLVIGLSLTASRSAWLYLCVFFVLSAGWKYGRHTREASRLVFTTVFLLIVFVSLQWLLSLMQGVSTATQRLASEGNGLEIRLAYWRHAWQMFVGNPLLGVGYQNFAWGNFELIAHDLAAGMALPSALYTSPTNNAHNLIAQILAEFGLLGLGVLGGGVYWIGGRLGAEWTSERWWMWAVLSILAIHSLLEFPLWYAYYLAVFVVVLGVMEGTEMVNLASAGKNVKIIVSSTVMLVAAALASTSIKYPAMERAYSYSPQRNPAYTAQQLQDDLASLQTAWFFDPWVAFVYSSSPVLTTQPQVWYTQLKFNSAVIKHWPNAEFVFRQVLLLALNNNLERAHDLLEKARAVYPDRMPAFMLQIESFAPFSLGARKFRDQLAE